MLRRGRFAKLPEQGGGIRADPLLRNEAVGEAVEPVAHVLEPAPRGGKAEVLAGVRPVESAAYGDAVARANDLVEMLACARLVAT